MRYVDFAPGNITLLSSVPRVYNDGKIQFSELLSVNFKTQSCAIENRRVVKQRCM
jgi:hypothetical protein